MSSPLILLPGEPPAARGLGLGSWTQEGLGRCREGSPHAPAHVSSPALLCLACDTLYNKPASVCSVSLTGVSPCSKVMGHRQESRCPLPN